MVTVCSSVCLSVMLVSMITHERVYGCRPSMSKLTPSLEVVNLWCCPDVDLNHLFHFR